MKNAWYPLLFSKALKHGQLEHTTLLGVPLILFRDETGAARCMLDRCPHRSIPLHFGRVVDGKVQCGYHGWEFNATGSCVKIPSSPALRALPRAACARTFPCVEVSGLVFVWPGDPAAADPSEIVRHPEMESPDWCIVEGVRDDDPIEHSLLIENLLDAAHVPYTHGGALAGPAQPLEWDFADLPNGFTGALVKPEKRQGERAPQRWSFYAPCSVRLDFSLVRPDWKFAEVHYVVPLDRRRTRLLWRMSRNFLARVPGVSALVARMSARVFEQDVDIIQKQQLGLDAGGPSWNVPSKADGMALRYRAWLKKTETTASQPDPPQARLA